MWNYLLYFYTDTTMVPVPNSGFPCREISHPPTWSHKTRTPLRASSCLASFSDLQSVLRKTMSAMSRLGALLRRSKHSTLISELRGFARVSNESSLQSGSRFSAPTRTHCDRCLISRFSSFQAFKSLPKVRDSFIRFAFVIFCIFWLLW